MNAKSETQPRLPRHQTSWDPIRGNRRINDRVGYKRVAVPSVAPVGYPPEPAAPDRTVLRSAAKMDGIVRGITIALAIILLSAVVLGVLVLVFLPVIIGGWNITADGAAVVMLVLLWREIRRLNS